MRTFSEEIETPTGVSEVFTTWGPLANRRQWSSWTSISWTLEDKHFKKPCLWGLSVFMQLTILFIFAIKHDSNWDQRGGVSLRSNKSELIVISNHFGHKNSSWQCRINPSSSQFHLPSCLRGPVYEWKLHHCQFGDLSSLALGNLWNKSRKSWECNQLRKKAIYFFINFFQVAARSMINLVWWYKPSGTKN